MNKLDILKKRIAKVRHQQYLLHKEASDLNNTTPARRIRINIMLDGLANTERKLEDAINATGWQPSGFGDRFIGKSFAQNYV
jgi:hypothetical protein